MAKKITREELENMTIDEIMDMTVQAAGDSSDFYCGTPALTYEEMMESEKYKKEMMERKKKK